MTKVSPLSRRIREARRFANMSRSELARQVQVHPSAALQWELDDGTAPTIRNLIKIARSTGVGFEWLATGRGSPLPRSLETPALRRDDFALDAFEERMLQLAREIPEAWRESFVSFLSTWLGKKT